MRARPSIQIDIPNNCSQPWEGMRPCGENKNCGACNTIVYDFTHKSDQEIAQFIDKKKAQRICGKFNASQLNRNLRATPSWSKSIAFLLPAVFVMSIGDIKANEPELLQLPPIQISMSYVKISGQLIDEETKEPILFANVVFKGTKTGTHTDEDGRFSFKVSEDILENNDSLVFTYVGYTTQVIKIDPNNCENLTVEIKSEQVFIGEIIIRKEPFFRRIFKRKIKKVNKA